MTLQAAFLPGDRLHLQHGPIDLIIGAEGAREAAFGAAYARFETVLTELTAELDLLRAPVGRAPRGSIARRMYEAALPFADGVTTPMIAVAGAVAEEILAAMREAGPLQRAYVNNGGDIALHLGEGARFRVALAGADNSALGRVEITARDGIHGIATSGQRGRSMSRGIADSVTVLARRAAQADAAATMLGNAVDLPGHPAIRRAPADELRPDSDLRNLPVVTHVGPLAVAEIDRALHRGTTAAADLHRQGRIAAAALFLQGQSRILSSNPSLITERDSIHA